MFTLWRQERKFTSSRFARGASTPPVEAELPCRVEPAWVSPGSAALQELWLLPPSTVFGTNAPKHVEEKLLRENLNFFPFTGCTCQTYENDFHFKKQGALSIFYGNPEN